MSYIKKKEYEIIPKECFKVVHNCSGCGTKTHYINTKRFRVNANGNRLDIWLIYQCEKCKHTRNLTIYERQKPASVPKEDYQRFLSNDEELAVEYGKNFSFFKKNKAEVDAGSIQYEYVKLQEEQEECEGENQELITIHNPYGLKIRSEKQIAEVLGMSRSSVKKEMEQESILVEDVSSEILSVRKNSGE